jgi:hypothetical protein
MRTSSSSIIGLIAIITAVVAMIGLVFIALFYTLVDRIGGPFGALNDLFVAVGALLSGVLAWVIYPIHRSYAPRRSGFALASALIGACLAPIGSALVVYEVTGWFLAGLVTTFGYALIGIWLLVLNYSTLHWIAFPRGLARFGIAAGWVMTVGILAVPGILARTDSVDTAQWFVLAALFVGGLGWNLLYTAWCIWLGSRLLSKKLALQIPASA